MFRSLGLAWLTLARDAGTAARRRGIFSANRASTCVPSLVGLAAFVNGAGNEVSAIYRIIAPLPLTVESRIYGVVTLRVRTVDWPPFSIGLVEAPDGRQLWSQHFTEPGHGEYVFANGWKVAAGSFADRLALRLVSDGRAEVVCWPCSSVLLKTGHSKNIGRSPDAFYTWNSSPLYEDTSAIRKLGKAIWQAQALQKKSP